MLTTGGAPGSTETDLYEISGQAYSEEYGDAASGWDWISTPIPPQGMAIGQLGTLDASGKLYVALPAHSQVNAKPNLQGTSYKYVVIHAKKYKLVSQCFSTTPANRDRKTLGVGEQVRIQFEPELPINAQWSCSGGSISTNLAKQIDYIAPSNSMFSSVAVSVKGQNKEINFRVLEPTGIAAAQIIGTRSYPTNTSGVSMTNLVWVGPTNVSFYRVQIMEVGMHATNVVGYYTNFTVYDLSHIGNGADVWIPLNNANEWVDAAADSGNYQPWSNGSFTWLIPGLWRIPGGTTNSIANGWDQKFSITPSGSRTINKFGRTVTRNTNNVYTTIN